MAKSLFPSAGYCSFPFFLFQRRLLPHLFLLGREGETRTGRRFSSLEFANVPSRHLLVWQSFFRQHSRTIDTYFELLGKTIAESRTKEGEPISLLPASSLLFNERPFAHFPLLSAPVFLYVYLTSLLFPFFSSSAHERTP